MSANYATRKEAIEREIIAAIEGTGEVADARVEFDIDAIADEVLSDYLPGYEVMANTEGFWAAVERHAR
ncbi:hypothetical protein [Serinibacter salmoneus]|uniref:Uncharacterized protein n=1 Tax=Serinibacter salmoneus TaxID=556530 RepID=A0A2A9D3M1_9MICO|nr:hypothetical protein [Serinibacter salmoneus]PFG21253.1 hypothetical protein ATL40_2876 [Serinibacter salmoneus]